MPLADELKNEVTKIFRDQWSIRAGEVVPEPENITLGNGAVEFERATLLYADLSGSTAMVNTYKWEFAAEVYKTFLYCAARSVRASGGTITSYDGDRAMSVFVGDSQCSNAVQCGLKINHARTGVRGGNDVVWVGRAANYAAKLTEINLVERTWITSDVYDNLDSNSKISQPSKQNMWKKFEWTQNGNLPIYGSTYRWVI